MLREQVLRGLGWEIVRIWSTDWWIDRAGTLEKVHAALEHLLELSRQTRERQKERAEAAAAAQEAIAKARTEAGIPAETVELASAELVARADQAAEAHNDGSIGADRHLEFDKLEVAGSVDPDAFFSPSYDEQLRRMIEEVAATEAPVRDTVLARRIARAHGWQRTGARIQDRVSSIALSCLKSTEEDVGVFFWTHDRGPEVAVTLRSSSEEARNVEEICMAELVALAKLVALDGKTGDGAVIAMANRLGLHRVRATSRSRFEKAIELAQ
jgi:hypothetical protein